MTVPLRLPLLTAAALLLASPAHAQRQQERGEGGERAEARSAQQVQAPAAGQAARGQDSMADSIRHVRAANRGQILSAERMHSDGREINRIKVVDDRGRVRVFEDDPQQRRRQRSRGDDD